MMKLVCVVVGTFLLKGTGLPVDVVNLASPIAR